MSLQETIEKIRPSVVQICVHTVGGNDHRVLGTGFFAFETANVLTAAHVIPTRLESGLDQLCLAVPGPAIRGLGGVPGGPPIFMHFPARVAAVDAGNDLALLNFEGAPPGPKLTATAAGIDGEFSIELRPVALATSASSPGVPIAASGFPLNQADLVTTSGIVAAPYAKDLNGSLRLIGDLTLNKGNSGGPVYESDSGRVVGLASKGITASVESGAPSGTLRTLSGLAMIVPARTISEFLAARNLGQQP